MPNIGWESFKYRKIVTAAANAMARRLAVLSLAAALYDLFDSGDSSGLVDEARRAFNELAVETIQEKTGLMLNQDDPLTDASISAALADKAGFEIRSVMNPDTLIEDLAKHAADVIEERTEVKFTNLLSQERVKADGLAHVFGIIKEKTELDLTGAVTFDDVQIKIQDHVRKKLEALIVEKLKEGALKFADPGVRFDTLLEMIGRAMDAKRARGEDGKALRYRLREVALGGAAAVVVASYARLSVPLKLKAEVFRKRARNRHAQQLFRERHGHRMRYQPIKGGGGTGGTGGTGGGAPPEAGWQ